MIDVTAWYKGTLYISAVENDEKRVIYRSFEYYTPNDTLPLLDSSYATKWHCKNYVAKFVVLSFFSNKEVSWGETLCALSDHEAWQRSMAPWLPSAVSLTQ